MVRCHRCFGVAVYSIFHPHAHTHTQRHMECKSWEPAFGGNAVVASRCLTIVDKQTNMTGWNNKTSMRWRSNHPDVSTTTLVDIKIIYIFAYYVLQIANGCAATSSIAWHVKYSCVHGRTHWKCHWMRIQFEQTTNLHRHRRQREWFGVGAPSTMGIQNFAHAIANSRK